MSEQPRTIDELLRALVDGDITDEEYARLADELRDDPAAQNLYIDYLLLDQALTADHERLDKPARSAPEPAAQPAPAGRPDGYRVAPIVWSIAAAVLFCAAAVAVYVLVIDPSPAVDPPDDDGPVIATLVDTTDTVVYEDNIAHQGGEYAAGTYSIEAGSADFILASRVTVNITGRTRLSMHTPMHATLSRGAARFVCPPGTEGFTVNLPNGGRVVDLGTAFVVRVDDEGRADVFVTEGSVRIESADGLSRTVAAGAGSGIDPAGVSTDVDLAALATVYPDLGVDGEAIDVPDGSFETVAVREPGNAHSPHWESDWEPGALFDPSDKEFAGTSGGADDAGPGGTNTANVLPDGGQVAFVYEGSYLTQTLGAEVEPGAAYRLRFAHGQWAKAEGHFGRYRVRLLAGDVAIIDASSDQINDGSAPAPGTFEDVQLIGRASLDAAGPLRIEFRSLDGAKLTFIDHVRLHRLYGAESINSPEVSPSPRAGD